MKSVRWLAVALLAVVLGCSTKQVQSPATQAAKAAQAIEAKLCVMTFNLRYAAANDGQPWSARRPVAKDAVRAVSPDVFGTQEGLYFQLRDLATDLPDYAWIGTGRDGGSRGEFMAIFYKKDRLEPLEYDHFWLSDTPDIIASVTWNHICRRMVTWVKFRDRRTGVEFYFWNTHLDHQVQAAREKGAALIRQKVAALKNNLPVILVGDFNATATKNAAYSTLVADDAFADTWFTAKQQRGPIVNTFHGYKPASTDGIRIDWILSRGPIQTDATEIITYQKDGQFPSDHFPVAAWIRVGRPQ